MAIYYYAAMLALSFLMVILYVNRWHKRFDVNMTAIFLLIPIVNLGYYLMYSQQNPETAIIALKFIYVGGCFLPWLSTLCLACLCQIEIGRLVRSVTFLLNAAMYGTVLTIGHYTPFYQSISVEFSASGIFFNKQYGPLHTVFYICVGLYLVADVIMIGYTFRKKKQVSRRILYLLVLPIIITVASYICDHLIKKTGYEVLPASYVLVQFVYLLIVHRMALYNASEMAVESLAQSGDTGFITVDFKHRYLSSNETAKKIIPELCELTVDRPVSGVKELQQNVVSWLNRFEADPTMVSRALYAQTPSGDGAEEMIYAVRVNYLYDGRKRRGYQIFLQDDTQDQKYIKLLDQYNSELEKEVTAKTEGIVRMHDRLILGMATMVESRDNSTGGHIRRTSEGVRILMEEIKKDPELSLPESFCKNIIKAAPMHDLGKIAVDDAILRKPGRYTREEYEVMKSHAAEGARIVHNILRETGDNDFRRIAENVAHYHHERIDGTGYPEGLKGDEIPLEARIMAIADVYDALVSKRVYKEKFTFEEADRIITEEMGKHFDQRLQKYYEAARPRLEAYYSAEGSLS